MSKIFDLSDTPKLKRNIFLTILLSLIIIVNAGVGGIFLLNIIGIAEGAAYLPPWMIILSFVVCLGNVFFALAVWYWRKLGVIGYGVLTLTAYIANGIVSQSFTNFFGLVGSSVLVLLVLPYWKQMK